MRAVFKGQRLTIDRVFALMLFCAFSASVLLVLVIGAGVYKDTVSSMEDRYTEKTCMSYVASKVHHYDSLGGVHMQPFGDDQAIVLEERLDDMVYVTLIYIYDGYVMELFMEKGLGLTPEDGEAIIKDTGLKFEQQASNLIKISGTRENNRHSSMYININSCR